MAHFIGAVLIGAGLIGVVRPDHWTQLIVGMALALTIATLLTLLLPRLYPWTR